MLLVEEYLQRPLTDRQSHLMLDLPCVERGGISTNHRGVLAQYLDTQIFGKPADLCHACSNDKCSNPQHLYWGTRKENVRDAILFGTHKTAWERQVEKYGHDAACKRNARPGNSSGKAHAGIPKTAEHKRRISEAIIARNKTK